MTQDEKTTATPIIVRAQGLFKRRIKDQASGLRACASRSLVRRGAEQKATPTNTERERAKKLGEDVGVNYTRPSMSQDMTSQDMMQERDG